MRLEKASGVGLATAAETFNPVIVDFYREVGYLPDAILNYLVLLGWSLDDRTEEFTREQMIAKINSPNIAQGDWAICGQRLKASTSVTATATPRSIAARKPFQFIMDRS